MPLKKGSGQKAISSNIKEIMHDYKKDGTIGNSKPKSKAKAAKQAAAIAYDKARESGHGKPKKKSAKSGSRTATKKSSAKKSTARKSTAKKSPARKTTRKTASRKRA